MDINSIPMSKIIEVELDTGYLLYEIFNDDPDVKDNPWAKLVYAYLTALTAGKDVTWAQMKSFGQNELDELRGTESGDADPKGASEINN